MSYGFDPVNALNLLLERFDNLTEALNKLTKALDDHAETIESVAGHRMSRPPTPTEGAQ